jgi:hypothetical protein
MANSARSIDDFILDDILGLENDNNWDRRRNRIFNSRDASLNLSLEKDRGRLILDREKDANRNPLRDSLNIIESIGFRALDRGDMRLDGLVDKKPSDMGAAASVGAGIGSIQQMEEVNKGLEDLLKSLGIERQQKEELTKDGLPQSLMQVYNDLNTTFIDFKTKYEGKYSAEEQEEKRRKERDDEMKEAGRREEREKLLKEISMRREEQESRLKTMLAVAAARDRTDEEGAGTVSDGGVKVTEASAAMSGQISALQAQLSERMQFLAALHADVMNDTPEAGIRPSMGLISAPGDSNLRPDILEGSPTHDPVRSSRIEEDFFMLGLSSKGLTEAQRSLLEKSMKARDAAKEKKDEKLWFKPESMRPFDAANAIRSDASRHTPTLKHETIARAAIHIQSNLNVAMESLAQRLPPQESFSSIPVVYGSPPPPSYSSAVSMMPPPPKYEDLDGHFPTVSVTSTPPPPYAPSAANPPISVATLRAPSTEHLKASLAIDQVLGPMNSSLERAELEWWKSKQKSLYTVPKENEQTVKSSGILEAKIISRDLAAPKPTFEQVLSSMPTAPQVPRAPRANAEESREKDQNLVPPHVTGLSSFANEVPYKYLPPAEGRALSAARASAKSSHVETSPGYGYRVPHTPDMPLFTSSNVGASSPTSITAPSSSPSKTERETYLKKMKAYRENLANAVK